MTAALLTGQLQSDDVPQLGDTKAKIAAELGSRLGAGVSVDGPPGLCHFGEDGAGHGSREWSDGGMIHARMAVWVAGAPRID